MTVDLHLQERGVWMKTPGKPWRAHPQPLNTSWLRRSWTSVCWNLRTGSPGTHTHTHVNKSVYVWERSQKKKKEENETYKVLVHVLHPVPHVGHHVVKHAERIPHHALHKHRENQTTAKCGAFRCQVSAVGWGSTLGSSLNLWIWNEDNPCLLWAWLHRMRWLLLCYFQKYWSR